MCPSHMMKIEGITRMEVRQLREELSGNKFAVAQDGTPYHGEVIATVLRTVSVKDKTAQVLTRLVDLFFAKHNVNHLELQGVFNKALSRMWLHMANCDGIMSDGSSVNISAYDNLNMDAIQREAIEHPMVVVLCLSHMFANGGKELCYPVVGKFNSLIQKVFARSESAKDIYYEVFKKH